MKKVTCCAVVVLLMAIFVRPMHANAWKNVAVFKAVHYTLLTDDQKKEMDQAVKMYLDKNPPETILSYVYSTVEKALPLSIPDAVRQKALNHVRTNITADIMKKMISAGLRRNFNVEEICMLSQYDESQLSDELKKKNTSFRLEISGEIGLLLAATSG